MDGTTVRLTLEGIPDDQRDQLIGELERSVKDADRTRTTKVTRVKGRKGTQDAGAILEIVLNAAAIVWVAKGFADWLKMHRTAEIKVIRPDGTAVEGKNLTARTAESAIRAALGAEQADVGRGHTPTGPAGDEGLPGGGTGKGAG